MTVVVDSSVAVKWFVSEHGSAEAEDLQRREEPIAPALIVAEVLSAIWKNVRMKRIGAAQMSAAASALPRQLAAIHLLEPLAYRASEIALALDHPVYDAFYMALAERERCVLVTADDRLYRKTRRTPFAKIVAKLTKA